MTNETDNTVSVLINITTPGATTPSFAPQQTFNTGIQPISVTAADINGDGKPDLIVANHTDNTVSVLINTTTPGAATPAFAAQQIFNTGNAPASVTAADINGDGKPDLIVANLADPTVSVLINMTTPGAVTATFTPQQAFLAGDGPISVAAADLNGDGEPDLIVSNIFGNAVAVLLNTTTPGATTATFSSLQTFTTGEDTQSVVASDVNGDGKPDLVVVSGFNTVMVLVNTTIPGAAMPSFAPRQAFAAGNSPFSVAAADLNGDGKPDLIVTNTLGSNTVSVLFNATTPRTTTPSFTAPQTFPSGSVPHGVTATDLNGDGKPDLMVANSGDNTVSALINATPAPTTTLDASSFAAKQSFAVGSNALQVIATDVNGDGEPDLVAVNFSANTVSVLLNTTAPGATTPSFATQQTFATGTIPASVTTADVNGDGESDLIVANSSDNTVSVLINTTAPGAATPTFATQQTFLTGASPRAVTTADVNGNGKPDLITVNNGANTVSVLLNTTAPGAATPTFASQQNFAVGSGCVDVTTADVNGDGKPDIIVANDAANTVSVLINTTAPGAGTPTFATQQTFATGNSPFSVAAADINGDGKPDLIAGNGTAGTLSVLINTTTTGASTPTFASQQSYSAGPQPGSAISADINGDGQPDLIAANGAGAQSVSVLLNVLYTVTASGSPATGTIHYDVPTATPTPTASATPTATATGTSTATPTATSTPTPTSTPTATRTATPTPTPTSTRTATPTSTPTSTQTPLPTSTATPTVTATPFPTPSPGQAGIITAPNPVSVKASAGQGVRAGTFSYHNTTGSPQQIGTLLITAGNPSALASLTATITATGQSATVSPVGASNSLVFNPPVVVDAGATETFAITAETASGIAARGGRMMYAALLKFDGSGPEAPLGGGLLIVGLMLVPLGERRRRLVVMMTLAGLFLTVAAAGCGSSSANSSLGSRAEVSGSGALSKDITLSKISANSSGTTVQKLSALAFE